MTTTPLSADDFRSMMRSDGITLVEFWGARCKPCLTFLPVFEAASNDHPDVTFATVDTQAEVTLATELGISGVPTVRAYRDGVQLMDHSGPMTLAMITSVVSQLEDLDVDDVIERALAREPLPAIRLMP
jgi:thioredoxin 1